MGGGDLNSKKAWHPNTMKNQERVWKAEQAAAEEKKRILELQREREQERDREELNKLSRQNINSKNETQSDNQLHWMYDKPDKKVQHEDYLLGKTIEKNYDTGKKSDPNEIPAVSRRVVGSSMTTSTENVQVDLARKLREDPLLLVKERERAARAALLNNPVQRQKLTELLRKEQEQKRAKSENSTKKKKKKDIDEMLTAKLNALGSDKLDLAKLLASDDSSSDSSSEEEKKIKKKKKKKDKKKKKKEEKRNTDSPKSKSKSKEEKNKYIESKEYSNSSKKSKHKIADKEKNKTSSKGKRSMSENNDDDEPSRKNKEKRYSSPSRGYERNDYEKNNESKYYRDQRNRDYGKIDRYRGNRSVDDRDNRKRRVGLSEEEKAAKLAEMASAGAEREVQRGERVAKQRLEIAAEDKVVARPRTSKHTDARSLPESLESRIHSNRHYIQRDRLHMNENFARR